MLTSREKPLIIFFAGFISLRVGLELSGSISVVLFMLSALLFSIFLIGMVMWRPMERRERARFFLLLLSSAEESGQSAEQAIISFSRNGKQSLGPELDRVAWHIRSGLNLPEALAEVPGCLPAQVVATLKVGHETGGVSTTLPMAQENLREKTRFGGAMGMEYIVMVLLVAVVIVWTLMVYIVPKYESIFNEYPDSFPAFTSLVLDILDYGVAPFIVTFFLFVVFYWDESVEENYEAGLGSSLKLENKTNSERTYIIEDVEWSGLALRPGQLFENIKRLQEWFPWHRKRLQRDYSRMLAILLDSGMPEEKAVTLAAQSTSNRVFKERARKVIAGLQSGMGLTEAIKLMDDSKEFQWRLTNALQTEGNFVDALSGWHQSLSAQADRQHQTFATLLETTCFLLMGLVVGSVVIAMFLPLIKLIELV